MNAATGGSSDHGNATRAHARNWRDDLPRIAALLLTLLAAAWLAACDRVSGTNDETHTEVTARILMPDGTTPAVGAKLVLVPVDGTVVSDSGKVDASGYPVFDKPADGVYAMTASLGVLASWTDSVKVVAGKLDLKADDTLERAGSIAGVVLPQRQHDPRTIVVNVLGTDAWANVGSDGKFLLPLLGAGTLRLKFVTTLPDYTTLYQTVKLFVAQDFAFPDTLDMPYTGIPVVVGLEARNDSATGDILLSWDAASHPRLVDYAIYRDSAGAVDYSTKPFASTTATSWRDTAAKSDQRKLSWRYRVAVRVSGSVPPGEWYEVVAATSVPPGLEAVNSIAWTSLGAPGGSQVGFLGGAFATSRLETGTDSVRLPVWTSIDGAQWSVAGTSFVLRRMGQTIVRASGFGSGRLWCFGRSGIGDGIEVSSSIDGKVWSVSTIPDSLWPGDANLFVTGSAGKVALVAPGARSAVLSGDSSGNWKRVTVTGRVLGIDDSGIWTDGGLTRPMRVDALTGRTTQIDLGTWNGSDSLKAIVPWKGGILLHAGTRLWAREGNNWNPRASSAVNAISSTGDKLLVRDVPGTLWRGL